MTATVSPAAPAAAPAAAAPVTADEFFRHAATHQHDELVDGVIVPMSPAGGRHNVIAGNLFLVLAPYVRARRLGHVFTDNVGYSLPIPGARRDTVRSPDASFVAAGRLAEVPVGFVRLAPDLALEVLSPSDSAADVDARMADCFAAGTRLLWVVDPERRTVAVHSRSAGARWLGAGDTLDGADVVPGFTLPVAALFEGLAPILDPPTAP